MFSFSILWIFLAGVGARYQLPVGIVINEPDMKRAYDFATARINEQSMKNRNAYRWHPILNDNLTDMDDNYKLSETLCNLMNKGVAVIIGANNAQSFNTIQSFSHALKVPYIVPTSTRSEPYDYYGYEVSMAPPLIDAVIKVIDILYWQKIYYVYDSDDGLWRLQKLYNHIQERKFPRVLDAFRIRDVNNSYDLLRHLDYKDEEDSLRRIVLDLSSTSAYEKILTQIIDVGMNRENYHYILASLTAYDLNNQKFFDVFKYGGVNITAFKIIQDTSDAYKKAEQLWKQHKSYYPDLFPLSTEAALLLDTVAAVHKSLQIGALRNKQGDVDSVHCWRPGHSKSENGPRVLQKIKQSSFNGLTGGVAFDITGMRNDFKIDVYELTHKKDFTQKQSWNRRELYAVNETLYQPRNDSAENRTQQVTTIMVSPFVMKKKITNGEPQVSGNGLEGFCIDLIRLVAKQANFDFAINIAHDYGRKNETTGQWSGMVGELINRTRQIAVAPLTITEDRERVVDFSKPFMNTGISIMIKKPDKVKPGVFSFMEPLDRYVWLCIAVGFLSVSFVLFFVGRFSPFEWTVDGNGKKEANNTFTISNTMWFSLGALMQQGSDISPRSLSGRVIGSAWWFFTLIIISSYTANLAAFLTIEKMLTPIDSADDLVNQKEIKYGTLKTGTSWEFFKDSEVQVFRQMYETMETNKNEVLLSDVELGVEKVRQSKGKYAFMLESSMNDFHSQQEPCDTMKVGVNLDNKGYGIATPIGYPLRDEINIAVLELREIGELHKLRKKWWYDKGKCGDVDGSKDATQSALTLSNVSGIFHILIGGLVLAMITSSLEYLAQKKLKANRAKENAKTQARTNANQNPVRRENFESFNAGAAFSPEQENGGYHFAPAGQLITFESPPMGNQTEI
ncbi:glutamate receptor-like isoform X1 [Haliotis rubra]|uniref:glutamate receptor-like isoform X1 n=1 Tax=Haliotis rubra TaxID=36100 RepID=UPI001EE62D0E|nr:glutamate receptor-like isoform X1 [Haliotis rubra]